MLITCFLLQTGCRVQSCVPLMWDSMKLLHEGVEGDVTKPRRPFLTIVLTPGKCQASGSDRHVRLRRHRYPGRCAVGSLAPQRAYLLDINYYGGRVNSDFRPFVSKLCMTGLYEHHLSGFFLNLGIKIRFLCRLNCHSWHVVRRAHDHHGKQQSVAPAQEGSRHH